MHYLCALEESETNDKARYIRGLRSDIWENMNLCQNIQEAYNESLRVEDR